MINSKINKRVKTNMELKERDNKSVVRLAFLPIPTAGSCTAG